MSDSIHLIRANHRERCFLMEQRKRNHLALGAFLRLQLRWRKDLPEAERKAIAAEASRMIKECDGPWSGVIAASDIGNAHFEELETTAKNVMGRLARELPVWALFGKAIRGFGEVSLAVIVAEAGDLADYGSVAKLWKRMGLAPGQGRVPKGLSREARAEA